MVSVQASRFALLNVDDDDDSDTNNKQTKSQKQQSQAAAKKKNKKKKKAQQSAETDELRNLAFNKGGSGKSKGSSNHSRGSGDVPTDQWEQWKKQDEEFAVDHFEKDLQAALLASKVEHEQRQQVKKELEAQGIDVNEDGASSKKKKKKEKKGKMTLDEFQKLDNSKMKKTKKPEFDSSSEEEVAPTPSPPVAQVTNPDPKFFDNVDSDVQRVLQKEKIQEQYKKSYALEHMRTQQYEDILAEKDKQIEELEQSNKTIQAELKQVKKRNQQLCVILSQGEMKDKTKILMELEELRSVRDELTEEVSTLTADLEKERSKVHQLQGDQGKGKGGKHGK